MPRFRSGHDNDLRPGTTYTYRVRANNDIGSGIWSNEVSQTTPANKPTTPVAPTAVGSDTDAIMVSWTAPDSGGADITSYKLQVRTDRTPTFMMPKTQIT